MTKFTHASLILCLAFAAINPVAAGQQHNAKDPSSTLTTSSVPTSSNADLKALRAPPKTRFLQEEEDEPSAEEVEEEAENDVDTSPDDESEEDLVGKPTKRECDTGKSD